MEQKGALPPGLHVVNDTQIVLVASDSPLDFMKEVAELHEDHQAGHGEPDVAKELRER